VEARIPSAPAVAQTADLDALLVQDHVVFRSTAVGETYGRLIVVALVDPAGQRAVLDSTCERVYATATGGVCVTADRDVVTTYGITELNANLSPRSSSQLDGLPSRARMSHDGSR
jgi:hypothetical protein